MPERSQLSSVLVMSLAIGSGLAAVLCGLGVGLILLFVVTVDDAEARFILDWSLAACGSGVFGIVALRSRRSWRRATVEERLAEWGCGG